MARPKIIKEEVIKEEIPTQKCTMCGEIKKANANNFYKSYSVIFKGNYENRMCLCKNCVSDLYGNLVSRHNSDSRALYECCKMLDIYYEKGLYESAISQCENSTSSNIISVYFQKINSLPQYRGKTFNDSANFDKQAEKVSIDGSAGIIRRWGNSYSKDDYEWLEDTYEEWCNKYKSDTMSEQKTFKLLTAKELEIMKARDKGSNTDKLEETYLKLMSAGNVTPRDSNASMDEENTKGLGIWVKDIEKYKPAEYFQDKKLYKDYDSLVDYLNRFVFRPMKNFLMKTKEYDKEFSVEDDFKVGDDE